jgi:hypothetical protein
MTRLKYNPDLVERVHYHKVPCSPCIHVAEDPPCHGKNICIQGLFDNNKYPFNSFIDS